MKTCLPPLGRQPSQSVSPVLRERPCLKKLGGELLTLNVSPQCYAYFKTVDKYVKAGKHIVLEFTHDFERSWTHRRSQSSCYYGGAHSSSVNMKELFVLNRHFWLRSPRKLGMVIPTYNPSTRRAETASQPV